MKTRVVETVVCAGSIETKCVAAARVALQTPRRNTDQIAVGARCNLLVQLYITQLDRKLRLEVLGPGDKDVKVRDDGA
jgi:hypothetical protein